MVGNFSHSVHIVALDGSKIRPTPQWRGWEVFAVGLLQKLGLRVTVFRHLWENKWKMQTLSCLDLPDVSCVEGRPLKVPVHLLTVMKSTVTVW